MMAALYFVFSFSLSTIHTTTAATTSNSSSSYRSLGFVHFVDELRSEGFIYCYLGGAEKLFFVFLIAHTCSDSGKPRKGLLAARVIYAMMTRTKNRSVTVSRCPTYEMYHVHSPSCLNTRLTKCYLSPSIVEPSTRLRASYFFRIRVRKCSKVIRRCSKQTWGTSFPQ
jgi:hypothetical protein